MDEVVAMPTEAAGATPSKSPAANEAMEPLKVRRGCSGVKLVSFTPPLLHQAPPPPPNGDAHTSPLLSPTTTR